MADNTVTVIGNITRDPELRFTPVGQAVATFGLAVNRRYQQNGEWEEQTSLLQHRRAGPSSARTSASRCSKGSRVIVNGRLEQRSWETQDGEKRSKVEIVADEIGPSLRWATAKIERNERARAAATAGGGGGGGSRPRADEPRRRRSRTADEEPF